MMTRVGVGNSLPKAAKILENLGTTMPITTAIAMPTAASTMIG